MLLREFKILKNLWLALKEFFHEDGLDRSSILAYYSIFSSISLLTFFFFLFSRYLGRPDAALKSLYPFSPDIFNKISPEFFQKAAEISSHLADIGTIGVFFSLVFGLLIITKIVQFINAMFHVELNSKRVEKGFMIRRVSEFSLLFLIGFMIVGSFLFSGFISTVNNLYYKNKFLAQYIAPGFFDTLSEILLIYILPFVIAVFFFFVLYKYIPEKVVYVKGAFIAALIAAFLWQLGTRAYAHYLVHISLFGKVKGPIIAVILYGFWMELSMGIMLYGAKLAYVFDRERNEKLKRDRAMA
jgi:YihY family inner membrane protein